LAKEQTYALLPAVPASVFVFGDRKWRHAILLTIPFFFAGILWFGLSRIPGKPQGAMGDSFTVQLPILTAADYGAAFAAPTRLTSFLFSLSPIQNALWIVLGIAALAAAGGLGYFLWKRHPRLAWVYLCAILLYLPVSNFLPIPSFWVAPYRMAETGICLACLFGVAGAYAYRSRRFVLGIPLAANLAMAACASVGAEQVWHSSNGFNSTVLAYDPHFFQSGLAMVDSMARQKKTTAALAAQNDMICYMLSDPNWESDRSPAQLVAMKDSLHKALQTNYGWAGEGYIGGVMSRYINLLLILHRTQEAQSAILTALDFTPQDADLNYEYGWAVMSQDRAKALQRWELAMMQRPKFGQCAAVLGHERFKDGNYAEAAKLLALAGETAPTFGSLWVELADARVHIGDYDGALTALETASPNYADQNGLATRKARILALMGRPITASAG